MSKLEERLAQQLAFAASDVNGRWRYPAPIRELHPMWCCEHPKREHYAPPKVYRAFCSMCEVEYAGADTPFHEYRRERDFRVDFAYPEQRVVVECEGVRYARKGTDESVGRHQTGQGFEADLEKYSALELAGWRVIRVGQRQITSGEALSLIEAALKERVTVEELSAPEETK